MKRFSKSLKTILMPFFLLTSLSSCTVDYRDPRIEEIYELAKESGFNGTYEERITSIRGEDGKDGHSPVLSIGENGNWLIDGNDTGIKAKGEDGKDGQTGPQGPEGKPGKDGNSVLSIELTSTTGKIDTYTITYSDGTKSTFTVTNGIDGVDGINGEPGKDGKTPTIEIESNGNWRIDGKDTNFSAIGSEHNKTFTVTFHTDGGILPEKYNNFKVNWGSTIELPIPVKKGHEFKGWFTGNTINDKQFSNADGVFKNLDLYAKYLPGTFTLTCDLNGGTLYGNPGPIYNSHIYGFSYDLGDGSNISKPGYEFKERTLNGEPFPSKGTYLYEDITIVATYVQKGPLKIKLNLNDGTYNDAKEIEVYTAKSYSLPKKGITKPGYAFLGRYNGDKKYPYEGIYNLEEDLRLAAKWEPLEEYTINIDYKGGISSMASTITTTNQDLEYGLELDRPKKDGYEFFNYTLHNTKVTENQNILTYDSIKMFLRNTKDINLVANYIGNDLNHSGDYIYFGSYPQSKVLDTEIIKNLETINDADNDGYIEYMNNKYFKKTNIINKTAFFNVEPIVWKVLEDGSLRSDKILDNKEYNYTSEQRLVEGNLLYANNYKYSTMRAFLNGYDGSKYGVENYTNKGFYDLAFNESEKAQIQNSIVDNSKESAKSHYDKYICENTNDYIYLPSASDLDIENDNYKILYSRRLEGTDFAKFNELIIDENGSYSPYYTRSPYSNYENIACSVSYTGRQDIQNQIYVTWQRGVVPALKLVK